MKLPLSRTSLCNLLLTLCLGDMGSVFGMLTLLSTCCLFRVTMICLDLLAKVLLSLNPCLIVLPTNLKLDAVLEVNAQCEIVLKL